MRQGESQERCGAGTGNEQAKRHDHAAIMTVCDRSGHQNEKQRWQELKKPDQAQIESVACDLIHLPADRYADDLHCEGGEEARGKESPVGGMAKCAEAVFACY